MQSIISNFFEKLFHSPNQKDFPNIPPTNQATRRSSDYQVYTACRNSATNAIKMAKKSFEYNLATVCKNNPKVFWNYVNRRTKVKESVDDLKKLDGSKTASNVEKAQVLNDFFASVFTRENLHDLPVYMDSPGRPILEHILVDYEAVHKKLRELNPNKSCGIDGIHPRVLKETADFIAVPLYIIFNKSILHSELPEDWKKARITPIFKKGVRSDPGNYRPVSLTSVPCKLLESIVRDSLNTHFSQNNIICREQHGFMAKRSCTTALLETMEDFTKYIDDGKAFDTVYLDFQKAFDSVPHRRLLLKLHHYGIRGPLLD